MSNFHFINNSNLPSNRVSCVIMSDYIPELLQEIHHYDINVIVPDKLNGTKGAEAYHSDMGVCHINNNKFVVARNNSGLINKLKLINADIIFSSDKICGTYPNISALNVCIFGNNLICNTKYVDKNIIDFCQNNRFKILHTNQGYSKCSSAIISSNALITADESIYNLCRKNQIDVLKISNGGIRLDGYNYGFIGGTCGLIDKHTLAFSGNIKLHKDYLNIKDFANNYHIDLLSLSGKILYDIGGILPVMEIC
ncbi:MAG: hypothetical protein PUG48_11405 [Clostridia bacterium]|nr:hypothetical protein [Clostridia bacterium]